MSPKGPLIRAIIEDLGFVVLATDQPLTFRVRTSSDQGKVGQGVATYDLTYPDRAFRFATFDAYAGNGQRDCTSWPDLLALLTRRAT